MLACARLGAVHSVVFGGFAAQELARRIEHAEVQFNLCCYCFYQTMSRKKCFIGQYAIDNSQLLIKSKEKKNIITILK